MPFFSFADFFFQTTCDASWTLVPLLSLYLFSLFWTDSFWMCSPFVLLPCFFHLANYGRFHKNTTNLLILVRYAYSVDSWMSQDFLELGVDLLEHPDGQCAAASPAWTDWIIHFLQYGWKCVVPTGPVTQNFSKTNFIKKLRLLLEDRFIFICIFCVG